MQKYKKLVNFNLVMGFLHLIQGFVMLFLSTSVIQKIGEFQPIITLNYLRFNPMTKTLESASKELVTLPFGVVVSIFLFISACAHFIIVINKKKYIENLENGINKFRWIEYAFTS